MDHHRVARVPLRRSPRIAGALALGVVAFVRPVAALADDDGRAVRLEYDASEGCPSRARFVDDLTRKAPRARIADEGAPASLTFHVRVTSAAATVTIDEAAHAPSRRTLPASGCDEAARAAALVVALAIAPPASRAANDDAAAAEPPSAEPPPSGAASPAPVRTATTAAPSATATTPRDALPIASASTARTSSGVEWSIGAGLQSLALGTGAATWAPIAWLEASSRARGTLAPTVRVSASRTLASAVDAANTQTTFVWTVGRLDVCPLRFGAALAVRPCVLVHAGVVSATGGGSATTADRTRPWIAPGAMARVDWSAARWLVLELAGGAVAPIFREDFVYRPAPAAYTPPAVVALAEVGVGVHL